VGVTSSGPPSELCAKTGEGVFDLAIVHRSAAVRHEERVGR
jgi:hypothetical protein